MMALLACFAMQSTLKQGASFVVIAVDWEMSELQGGSLQTSDRKLRVL